MIKFFYVKIMVRSIMIALSALLMGFLYFHEKTIIPALFVTIIFIIQVFELIYSLNQTNRKISYFFDAVQNEDFTLYFSEKTKSKSLRELNSSLNRVNALIRDIKQTLQGQEQYFKTILEHISTGILTFNNRGNILLANTAARTILHYEHLTHLDQIKRINSKLYLAIKELKAGDRKLVSFNDKEGTKQLALKSTYFKNVKETLQLVTIQDIKNELEASELESWIRLIRVLTHEIMNTIAPITSLSQTILAYYKNPKSDIQEDKLVSNTIKGLEVINERATGLISFVESYRKLTRVPQPEKKPVPLSSFIDRIVTLINSDLVNDKVTLYWKVVPADLEIFADKKQITQVLINLIKNSIEALGNSTSGKIDIMGKVNESGRAQITVKDNGPGIPADLVDKIFIPFFTTKESGSGIGLSLSRQIIQLHGGSLNVKSAPGNTAITIIF